MGRESKLYSENVRSREMFLGCLQCQVQEAEWPSRAWGHTRGQCLPLKEQVGPVVVTVISLKEEPPHVNPSEN
jgi:hypothetical protein